MMMDTLAELLKNGTLCSVAVYGITEAIKPVIKRFVSDWATSLIRIFALCCGTAFGFYLTQTPEGAMSGFCGASLSAVVVARVKDKIKTGSQP